MKKPKTKPLFKGKPKPKPITKQQKLTRWLIERMLIS